MGRFPNIPHPSASRRQGCPRVTDRLACVKHAASVQSEPGSNSSLEVLRLLFRAESQLTFSINWLSIGTRPMFALTNDRRESPHKLPVSIFKERPRARPGQTANYAAFHESVNSVAQIFLLSGVFDRATGKPGCRGRARSIAAHCVASTAAFFPPVRAMARKSLTSGRYWKRGPFSSVDSPRSGLSPCGPRDSPLR